MPSAVAAGEPTAAAREPPRRRRRVTAWDLEVLVGANVAIVVGLWWRQGGISEIHDAAGLLTSLGRVTGMVGALLALVQLLLLARIPVLDEIALDRVNGWHRWNGIACVVLLVAHTVLITAGYALADGVGLGREISDLFGNYSGVLHRDDRPRPARRGRDHVRRGGPPAARPPGVARDPRHGVPRRRARLQPPARDRARVPAPAGRPRVLVGALRGRGARDRRAPDRRPGRPVARDPPPARGAGRPGRGRRRHARDRRPAPRAGWRALRPVLPLALPRARPPHPRAAAVAVGRAGWTRAAAHGARTARGAAVARDARARDAGDRRRARRAG